MPSRSRRTLAGLNALDDVPHLADYLRDGDYLPTVSAPLSLSPTHLCDDGFVA
jgi:hypothetical protein